MPELWFLINVVRCLDWLSPGPKDPRLRQRRGGGRRFAQPDFRCALLRLLSCSSSARRQAALERVSTAWQTDAWHGVKAFNFHLLTSLAFRQFRRDFPCSKTSLACHP